jgi:hypothetical protein
MYIDHNGTVRTKPIFAFQGTGQTRSDSYYDVPVPTNGGCIVIAFYGHDTSTGIYNRAEINFVGHSGTGVSSTELSYTGGNGNISFSKTDSNTLRVTFNKNESSGTGSYGTVESVVVFGGNIV